MSAPNTSSSSALVSFTADPNYTKMEGFKQFKALYNQKNACTTHNNPHTSYLVPEAIYNQVKNSRCSKRSFKELSFQDFLMLGSIVACCHLKHLSLAPYYHTQMKHCTQKWDMHNNQGAGTEVVDTCCQLVSVISVSLYHSMANVQEMVRSNCGSLLMFTNSSLIGYGRDASCQ